MELEYLKLTVVKTTLQLGKFTLYHCLVSQTSEAVRITSIHPEASRVMSIGTTHKMHKFIDMLKDESYINWVGRQGPVHEDLKVFKDFASKYNELKGKHSGKAKTSEFEVHELERLTYLYFK